MLICVCLFHVFYSFEYILCSDKEFINRNYIYTLQMDLYFLNTQIALIQ